MPVNMDRLIGQFSSQAEGSAANAPKRGEEIFAGTDYPRDWSGFVGQAKAKEQLAVSGGSAKARGVRHEHTLLASGIHGVGKTTLAHILAAQMDVGLLVTTGPLTVDDFRELLHSCEDHDIIFVDEAHRLVERSRTAADWLLPWMIEGKLITKQGAEVVPDVTLIAATTDAGKLPETLLSRFMVTPEIVHYSDAEAAQIAAQLAVRMSVPIPDDCAAPIATAADKNPRAMRKILTAIRDLSYAYPDTHPNLDRAFDYAGVSPDGLSLVARDILLVLASAREVTASVEYIQAQLGEPGPLKHHEKQLLQRGLMTIRSGRGRILTEDGARRAWEEAQHRMKENA